MESKRNSNFELLRILAMLMIVCYHIYCHCIGHQLVDPSFVGNFDNGLFNCLFFYKKLLILAVVTPFGKIGDVIFILISGYFMVPKGSEINLIKISKKLLFQQLFAALLLMLSSTIVWKIASPTYINLLDFNSFQSMSWFIGYYFLIIVIAKLFLNKYLENKTEKEYFTFLIVLFALVQFSFTAEIFDNFVHICQLVTGLFVFSLGGFLHRYNPFKKIKTVFFILIILASVFIVMLSYYNAVTLSIEDFVHSENPGVFLQTIPGYADNSILCIAVGISLFEIFSRIQIPNNKIINYLGASTLMVYLFHDNRFISRLWGLKDWITLLYYHPIRFIGELILCTICTFLCGVAVYSLYLFLSKKVFPKLWKLVLHNNSK